MNAHDVAALYRAYGYVVFRRCLAYLADVESARTAVRQVFVRAVRNDCSFHAFGDPQSWLYRSADDLCVGILEADARDALRRPELSLLQLRASVAHDDYERLGSALPVLRSLAPDQMRFAVMFFVDELTEEELSCQLGLSRRAVARRVSALVRSASVLATEPTPS